MSARIPDLTGPLSTLLISSGTIEQTTQVESVAEQAPVLNPTIPVLDLADFYSTDPMKRTFFMQNLRSAATGCGFFAMLNTGIDTQLLDAVYEVQKKFYALPLDEKKKCYDPNLGGQFGFVPGETAAGGKKGDFKEFFHVGRPSTNPENLWPRDPEFKKLMEALFLDLEKVSIPILEGLAEIMGVERNFLTNMTKEGSNLLRSLYYPKNPPTDRPWGGQHTDIDFLAIIPKATADGLEVQLKSGEWIPVMGIPEGAIICNIGDKLTHLTNGLFYSAVHRVNDPGKGEERHVSLIFIHPRPNDKMDPISECINQTGGILKYPKATSHELLMVRLLELGIAAPGMLQAVEESQIVRRLLEYGLPVKKELVELLEIHT